MVSAGGAGPVNTYLGESDVGPVDDAVAEDMGVCGLDASELDASEGSAGANSREEGRAGGIEAGHFDRGRCSKLSGDAAAHDILVGMGGLVGGSYLDLSMSGIRGQDCTVLLSTCSPSRNHAQMDNLAIELFRKSLLCFDEA